MNAPQPSQFTRSWGPILGLIAVVAVGVSELPKARAAEKPTPPRLEDFLKRLGFEAIEFKWDDRHAVVQGRLGGKKRTFLVDTGWAVTTLDEHTARGLKTLGELSVKLDDSFMGRLSDPDILLMEELTIGRAQFLNQPAQVRTLEMDFVRWRHDGVLGCDFFHRNHCLVDCGGRCLYVRASRPSEAVSDTLARSLRLSRLVDVPMRGKYGTTVDVEINGQTVKLLVDTGSFATVLDDSQIQRLGLAKLKYADPPTGSHLREQVQTTVIGIGDIGSETLSVSELMTFRIGSQQWKHVQAGVANLARWGLAKPGTRNEEIQGLLGIELLVNHGALIDFSSHRLWFRAEP